MTALEYTALGVIITIIVATSGIAIAWGKIMTKVDNNKEDITKIIIDCEKHRIGCLSNMQQNFAEVFRKLDNVQKDITQLAVQIAKVERTIE